MFLRYDAKNPRAVHVAQFLEKKMDLSRLKRNLVVTVGGDGFMLKTVREEARTDLIFLGINCGRLGFLMNDIPEDMEKLPDLIQSDRLRVRTFPRIAMVAEGVDGSRVTAHALNDVYLERTSGQGCHIKIRINGMVVVEHMVCDGLIFCTALGSTAYAFSAGASPCHPSLNVLGVVPVCPHAPRLSSLYVPLNSSCQAEILNRELRPVQVVADGFEYGSVAKVSVSDAGTPVRMAFFPGHHFTATLVSKLLTA